MQLDDMAVGPKIKLCPGAMQRPKGGSRRISTAMFNDRFGNREVRCLTSLVLILRDLVAKCEEHYSK